MRFLLHLLDYVGTLFAFILVFFGLWVLFTTGALGLVVIAVGFGVGFGSFAIGKKLRHKPMSQERM